MKKTGYDQFFQKARQNTGLESLKASAQVKPRAQASKPRFQVSDHQDPLMALPKAPKATAQELRTRLQANNRRSKKNKGIPWKLVGISFLGLVLTATGYVEHERIENFLKRVEVGFVSQSFAEEAPAKPTGTEVAKAEAPAEKAAEAPKKKDFTDEELNHFAKLNERKRELDAREEELSRLEAELTAQKAELEKRMSGLETTRREISSVLEDRVKADDKKVETLVQMYSNMKPQQAAKVFEEMDEDLAVEIIGRMKKKNAAEIMNIIKPDKAKVFAEKFAGYKRD
ncbi:MAG: hypothetical protein KF681_05970 [Bdellovibrionaceae bacterium]|nr:hypothetical protein [Pseudobdellovibrionaceae bacterium]